MNVFCLFLGSRSAHTRLSHARCQRYRWVLPLPKGQSNMSWDTPDDRPFTNLHWESALVRQLLYIVFNIPVVKCASDEGLPVLTSEMTTSMYEFHHLLSLASGRGATSSLYPLSITWSSHIADTMLAGWLYPVSQPPVLKDCILVSLRMVCHHRFQCIIIFVWNLI